MTQSGHEVLFKTCVAMKFVDDDVDDDDDDDDDFRVRLIHQRKISFSLSLSHLAIGRS